MTIGSGCRIPSAAEIKKITADRKSGKTLYGCDARRFLINGRLAVERIAMAFIAVDIRKSGADPFKITVR
jgi:hypothetical protein